jgi:hypothetical protein
VGLDELRPVSGARASPEDVTTLGADVISRQPYGFTLTRLHYRYGRGSDEDLVFRAAPPIRGGQGIPSTDGAMEQGAMQSEYGQNTFQGRYVMLHPWEGEIACESPQRGRWGGPPGSGRGSPGSTFPSGNGAMARGIAPGAMQRCAARGLDPVERGTGLAGEHVARRRGAARARRRDVRRGRERAELWLGGVALVGLLLARRRRAR